MKTSSFTPEPTVSMVSEDCLIDRALQGDQRAYTLIFQQHHRMLSSVIARYLDREEDIEETLHDAYLRAFRALPGFRRECKLGSWLCRIAITTAINNYRGRRSRYMMLGEDHLPELPQGGPASPEAQRRLECQEVRYWVHQALARLAGKDALVLRLYYLDGLSVEEICQDTGLTASNIKTRLMRARQRLRELVERQFAPQLLN